MSENSLFRDVSAQVSQNVFLAYLTVLRLITTVWHELSEHSYFARIQCTSITNRSLSIFESLIGLLQLYDPKVSENWYLRDFSKQVSQIVSLSLFDHFTAYYNCMTWNMSENSYLREFSAQVSQIVSLSLFHRFTSYYNCMTWNVRNLISLASSVHKYHKSLLSAYLTVLRLLQLYDLKCQKTHVFAIWVHKYHKSLFLACLTVLRLITTVWTELSENSYLHNFSA